MVVGDDHIYVLGVGIGHRLVCADPGVAGQEQIDATLDDLPQNWQVHTV